MCKYSVIHKPEVHNMSQRRQRRTEPRSCVTCADNLIKFGIVVPEICSQTDKRTDTLITIFRSPLCDVVITSYWRGHQFTVLSQIEHQHQRDRRGSCVQQFLSEVHSNGLQQRHAIEIPPVLVAVDQVGSSRRVCSKQPPSATYCCH